MPKLLLALTTCAVFLSSCALPITEKDFLRPGPIPWPTTPVDPTFQRSAVTVHHIDGNVSRGVHLYSPNARGTVLFFQGNGETVDREGAIRLWHFQRLGLNAFIFDRRGYGQTSGKPSIENLISDALKIFDDVRSKTQGRLIVHGFSLGTSLAANVAKNRKVDLLVIEGGTTSVSEYVDIHLPWYLKAATRLQISPELAKANTANALAEYDGPLLIAVGENDRDTVPELSRRLFEALPKAQKQLVVVPGAPHQALITATGFEAYEKFLEGRL